jgi:hypothetical protein
MPHLKNRCRAQEAVVVACLELNQPQLARRFIPEIGNWRRGAAWADLAVYCIQHGYRDVQPMLDLAAEIAATATQDWRRDRVMVKIAHAHALLDQMERAEELTSDVDPSETGKLTGMVATTGDDKAFDSHVATLDTLIAGGQFDIIRNALVSYTQILNRHYDNAARRKLIEEKVKTAAAKLPLVVRLDLLLRMAECALDHHDQSGGLALVDETQGLMDGAEWPPRFGIPLRARVAAMRFRAGDKVRARRDLDAALAECGTEENTLQSFDRAGVLRPLAEAYQQMNDAPTALQVYRRAVEAGAVNPNLRPRTEDLSATCCSMAIHGIEPDEALWKRMHEIREELGRPQQ